MTRDPNTARPRQPYGLRRAARVVRTRAGQLLAAGRNALPFADPSESGRIGITINEAGEPNYVLHVCSHAIDTIAVAAIPADEMAAWPLIYYVADRPLEQGVHEVNPSSPPPGWRIGRVLAFDDPDQRYSVHATDPRSSGFVAGVHPTGAQVTALRPGQVLVGIADATGARTVPRAAFDAERCDDPRHRL